MEWDTLNSDKRDGTHIGDIHTVTHGHTHGVSCTWSGIYEMGYTGWDTHKRPTHGVRNTWSGIHGIGHT